MRAVIFDGTLSLADIPRPVCDADEALIRLRLGGICNTDLELMRGYKNFSGTLGHEFVGDVIEGPDDWIGQRVVGEINIACGSCDMCQRGLSSHCRYRRTLGMVQYDGAFAEYFRLPVQNLHRVPDSVTDQQAVFTEPLAAACQVLETCSIHPTDRVILLGAGKLGLLIAQVLRLTGADLTVIVRQQHPADLLAGWGIRAAVRSEVPDNLADVVVDCTGSAEGFADALNLVRPRGAILLKSSYAGIPAANLTQLVVSEIRVVGSRCGPQDSAHRQTPRRSRCSLRR
ncbi:MAG TPA: alcohol dehydrogenase catalytic domain-containing protein, partial [Aggregatilineaceae bacterium]|nr:alcohol dehydrogenase catalytic domain-containing protein [Aggregatilineaceae bacterium]